MRRTCLAVAVLMSLAFGPAMIGAGEARGQWVEVSRVRYGLLGRPRAVETYLVPAARVVRTATVVPTRYVVGEPVVATRYVEAIPAASMAATRYVEAVPTTYVTTSYPVVTSGYVSAAPVVRTYVPAAPVFETRAIYIP